MDDHLLAPQCRCNRLSSVASPVLCTSLYHGANVGKFLLISKKHNRPLTCYQVKHKDYTTYPFYSKNKRLTETGALQCLQRLIPIAHDTKKPLILRQKSGQMGTESASQRAEMAIRLFYGRTRFSATLTRGASGSSFRWPFSFLQSRDGRKGPWSSRVRRARGWMTRSYSRIYSRCSVSQSCDGGLGNRHEGCRGPEAACRNSSGRSSV